MALLPGLTSHDSDTIRSRGNPGPSRGGRVVTNAEGARPGSLAPQAAPVDTYFRPERAPEDNSVAQLAESLASLNPALMRFAAVRKETQDETLSARVTQRYAGKSYDEQMTLMKDDPDAQSLLGRRAIAANVGRAAAQQAGRAAAEFYETQFDKDGGDLDGYLNGKLREAIDAHPDDPLFAEQFAEVFQPMAASIRAEHTKYRVGRTQERTAETVHGSWLGTVQSGIIKGDSPSSIVDTLQSSYETNKQGLKMSFADQDKAAVGIIQQLTLQMDEEPGQAEKLFGVIKELAGRKLVGEDGKERGRLLDSATLGPDVAKLIGAAEGKLTGIRELESTKALDAFDIQAENGNLDTEALDGFFNDPAKKGVLTQARRSSIMARDRAAKEHAAAAVLKAGEKARVRGDLKGITEDAVAAADGGRLSWIEDRDYLDENGEVKTVSIDAQRKQAASALLDREQRRVKADPRAPEVVANESFNRQVTLFSEGNLEHPQWSRTLSAGVSAMSTVDAGGAIKDATRQGYDLYKRLYAKNPNYLRSQLDGDEANVYEAARIIEETGVAQGDEALVATQRYFSDPTRVTSASSRVSSKDVMASLATKTEGEKSFWDYPFSGRTYLKDAENVGVMADETEKLAKVLVGAGGIRPETAIAKAAETVRHGYQTVNGWAVKTADRRVPADFGELATGFLREWHGRFGDKVALDFEDLTIAAMPNSPAGWQVVVKETGLPALPGAASVLTLRDLRGMKEKANEAARVKAAADNAKRNEPIFDHFGVKIGAPRLWWDPADAEDFKRR